MHVDRTKKVRMKAGKTVWGSEFWQALHSTTQPKQHTSHYITLPYITLHYITIHCITLHYLTLHYITLHYTTLHYLTLHYLTYITLPYIHYITLHYIALHCITLHCIALHYIALHYIPLHTCMRARPPNSKQLRKRRAIPCSQDPKDLQPPKTEPLLLVLLFVHLSKLQVQFGCSSGCSGELVQVSVEDRV